MEYGTLEHNLTNHTPSADVAKKMEEVRAAAKELGKAIVTLCPDSREASLSLTNLEQATMWAMAALARYQ